MCGLIITYRLCDFFSTGLLFCLCIVFTGDAVSVDSLDMSKQPNGEPVYDNVRVKNFPIMVEELREYIEQMSEKEGFKREYNLIPWGLRYSREVAIQPDNKLKNRYGNIIACKYAKEAVQLTPDGYLLVQSAKWVGCAHLATQTDNFWFLYWYLKVE